MVDVQANSQKLKDRARRVGIVTASADAADELLRRARWNVRSRGRAPHRLPQPARSETGRGLDPRRHRRGHQPRLRAFISTSPR
jgi:hypothetical protein